MEEKVFGRINSSRACDDCLAKITKLENKYDELEDNDADDDAIDKVLDEIDALNDKFDSLLLEKQSKSK